MVPRSATPDDAAMLARLHVAAWHETYPGLLPAFEIARRTVADRHAQWTAQIAAGTSRIAVLPCGGFAQMGPQREPDRARDWPDELFALYLLRAAQGRGGGQALLAAVAGAAPFTALVVEGNARACAFYVRSGAVLLDVRDDCIGAAPIRECVYGWPDARSVRAGPDDPRGNLT